MTSPADWYRGSYPEGPEHNPRCLAVLAAWQPLYNIKPVGLYQKDGGFRRAGGGIQVTIRGGNLSTYDGDELTRLVVAAHRYACRVAVSSSRSGLVIYVHPRHHDGDRFYNRHPGLVDLRARTEQEVPT